MTKIALRKLFTKRQPNLLCNRSWRATTPLYWLMDRLVQVKLTLWKVSSIMGQTLAEVSCQGLWRKSFITFRCRVIKISLLWSGPVTYRFIMRSFQICWKLRDRRSRSGKTRRRVSLWRDFQSGLFAVQMRSIVCCREVLCQEPQRRQRWTISHQDPTPSSLS